MRGGVLTKEEQREWMLNRQEPSVSPKLPVPPGVGSLSFRLPTIVITYDVP